MHYYSHKLFWRGAGQRELEILDVKSRSLARMSLETSGEHIQAFAVDHDSKYIFPGVYLILSLNSHFLQD